MNTYEEGKRILAERRAAALRMGGPEQVERQHRLGKLTCRERVYLLFDGGSFVELGRLVINRIEATGKETIEAAAGGVVVGYGNINGRPAYVEATDGSIAGGSGASDIHGPHKGGWVHHLARRHRVPIIFLKEAGAARVQQRVGSSLFMSLPSRPGDTLQSQLVDCSGDIPQVCAIMGNGPGGAAFTANQSDFVAMVKKNTFMAIAGPPVVQAATAERLKTYQDLGGAEMHARETGQVDYVAEDDEDCLRAIQDYLSYMPSSCDELPPRAEVTDDPQRRVDELMGIVPENLRKSYDMYDVIKALVDGGRYLPVKKGYGRTIVTCLARINGYSVGIVANQPNHLGGATDAFGAYKYVHFAEICSAFHIPIVSLVDTPGMIIGSHFERQGTLKGLARILRMRRHLTVPNITVVLRKAYGLGYWVMGGRAMNPDFIYGWPIGSISQMPPDALVEVLYKTQLAEAEDREALKQHYVELFQQDYAPWGGVEAFGVDDIIEPGDTRRVISRALEMAARKITPGFKHEIYP